MRQPRSGAVGVLLLCLCLACVQAAGTKELTVGPSGANFSIISDAVAAAEPNDTIFIQSGTYNEGIVVIDKPLRLVGEDAEVSYPQVFCINFTLGADGIVMERLTIWGDTTWSRALSVRSDNNTLTRVFIGGWTAMEIKGNNTTVADCDVYSVKGGLNVEGSENTIARTTITRTISNPSFWVTGSRNLIVANEIGGSAGPELWGITGRDNIAYLNTFVIMPVGVGSDNLVIDASTTLNTTTPVTYRYNGTEFRGYLGNQWADYAGGDGNGDGIGDLPYLVSGSTDRYPLVAAAARYEVLNETGIPPPFSLTTQATPWEAGCITTLK